MNTKTEVLFQGIYNSEIDQNIKKNKKKKGRKKLRS